MEVLREYPSLPPASGPTDPASEDWLGLTWSHFNVLGEGPTTAGVYRIRDAIDVVYLGESKHLRARISTYAKSKRFGGSEISWGKLPEARNHHLKERETDLIGAYYMESRRSPKFQYSPSVV